MAGKSKVLTESGEEVTYSGDTRVVKHLLFPYFYEGESPMQPGVMVFFERLARRGEVVDIEESGMRPADLAKGEHLGSFFNDDELKAMEGSDPVNGPSSASDFAADEASEQEIAVFIQDHKLNINETVALANGDRDTAQRVLEAESIATEGDSRKGVVAGLEAVIAQA